MKKLLSFLALFPLLAACANTEVSSLPRQSLDDPYREIEYALTIDGAAGEAKYDASKVEKVDNHPLNGKTIYWLGSSVTYGSAASGMSMADYLSAKTGAICVKEAVSGTTIFDDGRGNCGGCICGISIRCAPTDTIVPSSYISSSSALISACTGLPAVRSLKSVLFIFIPVYSSLFQYFTYWKGL